MKPKRRIVGPLCGVIMLAGSAVAQQPDTAFRFSIARPAFPDGSGPTVCVDEAHANLHTAGGTYGPFATLLRADGFHVEAFASEWSEGSLQRCRALVVANAVAAANVPDRSRPHTSAFSKADLDAVIAWLAAGGALFLIADHEPFPGAARDLGLILGVDMLDAFAGPGGAGAVIAVFGTAVVPDSAWSGYAADRKLPVEPIAGAVANPGTLGSHAILRGRSKDENVRWVVTFTGHAFHPSDRVRPLLVFGPRAVGSVARQDAAMFPIGGWLQAGALEFGRGRAVVLAEASACTAQIGGPNGVQTGMNIREAPDNAQFCLNIVRWLTRVLN